VFFTFAGALAYRAWREAPRRRRVRDRLLRYPDCRDDTVKAMQLALNLGNGAPLRDPIPR